MPRLYGEAQYCKQNMPRLSDFIDDNNRKPVCRLYLDSNTNKRLVLLDENKKEIPYKIASIDDIYNYTQQLTDAVVKYI